MVLRPLASTSPLTLGRGSGRSRTSAREAPGSARKARLKPSLQVGSCLRLQCER
ncbi:unnamed protein product [Symbiodinium sp. KB8]|nr:unnamed protein product [Symbiodinium sp. KB8]